MPPEGDGVSPLAHFDFTELLDALSTGLMVLDAHLCVVYANVGAQDMVGISLKQARGHPIGQLFAGPQSLVELLRRSLTHNETCSGHEFTLAPLNTMQATRPPVVVDITVTPLEGPITGTHLLLELVDARQRGARGRSVLAVGVVRVERRQLRSLPHVEGRAR